MEAIPGVGFLALCPILYFRAPGPSLVKEDQQHLWIKGCGKEFHAN